MSCHVDTGLGKGRDIHSSCATFTHAEGREAVLFALKPGAPLSLKISCPSGFYGHSKDIPLSSYLVWVEFLSQQQQNPMTNALIHGKIDTGGVIEPHG